MQKIKGALEIVSSFSRLKHENVRLLFLGYPEKAYENIGIKAFLKKVLRIIGMPVYSDRIKKIAQKDARIIMSPYVRNVKSLLREAYCQVSFPTIPHAILPIAESIILGIPVISVDTPEAREYSMGQSAILVKMYDTRSLFEAMVYALDNPGKLKEMVQSESEAVKMMFDVNTNHAILDHLYRNLIGL
jgi:glycosyltransferase involved in cell wall biosynthesis